MIEINDYTIKIISKDNYDIKYKDSINESKRFKPYKWYHFVLFIWGLLKFYTELLICLSYSDSDWFWNYQNSNTQYGKDIIIYFTPKYLQKAILARELEISRSMETTETTQSDVEFIKIEPIDLCFSDNGKGEIWDRIEIDDEIQGTDYIYKRCGYKYEFSFDKLRSKIKDCFNKNKIGKYLNCNYEKFEYKIFESVNNISDKQFIF